MTGQELINYIQQRHFEKYDFRCTLYETYGESSIKSFEPIDFEIDNDEGIIKIY